MDFMDQALLLYSVRASPTLWTRYLDNYKKPSCG